MSSSVIFKQETEYDHLRSLLINGHPHLKNKTKVHRLSAGLMSLGIIPSRLCYRLEKRLQTIISLVSCMLVSIFKIVNSSI